MGWMETLGRIIQTPQSALTGATLGLMRDFGNDPEWARDIAPDSQNAIAGLIAGLKGGIKPSDVMKPELDNKFLDKVLNTTYNVGYDPINLLALAPAKSAIGVGASKFLGPAERAEGVSRLSGEALKGALARATGRTYQGTLGSDENNLVEGFGAGMLGGVAERAAGKIIPSVWGKLAREADTAADAIPSAVQTVKGGRVPQGMELDTLIGPKTSQVRGNFGMPDVDGPIEAQLAVAGEIGPRRLIDIGPGPTPIGELMPATARVGNVGARPMGPIPEFADVSMGQAQQPSFMDQLVEEAVAKAIPQQGPANVADIMIDPTLTGQARDDYLLNALEQLLRRTG